MMEIPPSGFGHLGPSSGFMGYDPSTQKTLADLRKQLSENNRLLRALNDKKEQRRSRAHKSYLVVEGDKIKLKMNTRRNPNKVAPEMPQNEPDVIEHAQTTSSSPDKEPRTDSAKSTTALVEEKGRSPTPTRVQSAESASPSGSHSSPVTNGETAVKNLTEEQIEEFRKAFNFRQKILKRIFDKDGDGNVSTDELGKVMRELGQNPSEDELQEMIEEIDKDGNGEIDFDEFLEMMAKQMNAPSLDQEIEEAWKLFNNMQEPTITKDHIRRVMERLEEYMTKEELEAVLRHVEVDNEDQITFEAFSNMMKSNPLEQQQPQPPSQQQQPQHTTPTQQQLQQPTTSS
ncbi:uncharacterized protein LOC142345781 isoform X3 [Convolutriloba macropyga]|uniref:uncharacterized protein LOC142345781 isoform X3 n=1 Tax=Convolutriloba macropyga TaxID=536237 RepID=UPI003F523721